MARTYVSDYCRYIEHIETLMSVLHLQPEDNVLGYFLYVLELKVKNFRISQSGMPELVLHIELS